MFSADDPTSYTPGSTSTFHGAAAEGLLMLLMAERSAAPFWSAVPVPETMTMRAKPGPWGPVAPCGPMAPSAPAGPVAPLHA